MLDRPHQIAMLLLAASFALPVAADELRAHELPRERTLLIQVARGGVEVMALHREPPGEPVQLLLARFDFDRDGELEGLEAFTAATEWSEHALRGLTVRLGDGGALELDEPRAKFQRRHDRALASALWFRHSWSRLEPGERRRVSIARSTEDTGYTTLVSFQRTDEIVFAKTPGGADSARVGPYRLEPGERLSIGVRRTDGASDPEGDEK